MNVRKTGSSFEEEARECKDETVTPVLLITLRSVFHLLLLMMATVPDETLRKVTLHGIFLVTYILNPRYLSPDLGANSTNSRPVTTSAQHLNTTNQL